MSKPKPALTPHEKACAVAANHTDTATLSEADTRHRVIDVILHDVLCWPRAAVVCEAYIDPGFADFVLTGTGDSQLLFLEAKKEGVFFILPNEFSRNEVDPIL